MLAPEIERRLVAILAADIVGYSRLIEADEAGTLGAIRDLRREVIDQLLARHHGRIVKLMGDGIIAEFASVVDAVICAVAVQRETIARQADTPPTQRIIFRAGINLGDVVVEEDDLLGDGVNVAARLEQLCNPGGVLISGTAYDQLQGKIDLPIDYAGEQYVKNIARPVRTYRVRLDGSRLSLRLRLRRYHGRLRWTAAALAALTFVAAFVILGRPGGDASRRDKRLTVAVLPFETSSEAAQDKWLGDGIAEDIMTELSRSRDVGVVARNSSFRYASQPIDIQTLRRDLNVDFVLQGSVRLLGDQLRLVLQLVDTETGNNTWAERYDRPFTDVFSVRQDILNQISARLLSEAQNAVGERVAGRKPNSLDAFELVLRAQWQYQLFTRDGAFEGLAMAERAVEMDPDYSAAWQILARLVIQFYVQPYDSRRGDPQTLERALAAARKAVTLDSRHSTALATLGLALIWKGEHSEGLGVLRQAILLNPSDAVAVHLYADALSRAGHQREALAAWDEGARLDPFVLPLNQGLIARSHSLLGDFETAFGLTSDCIRRAPETLPCYIQHIVAASGLGRKNEVALAVSKVRELAPRFTVSGWRDIIKYGDAAEAETLAAYLVNAGLDP
jgi:class 3 adenylate cyclase/TolB-like protein